MRKVGLFGISFCFLTTAMFAGESPQNEFSWTNAYVGINFGIGGNKFYFPGEDPSENSASGFLGGGQIGYIHQLPNNIVLGIEADFQTSNIKANYARYDHRMDHEWDIRNAGNSFLYTGRARLGYGIGYLLPYATGGVACEKFHYTDEEGGDIENEAYFEETLTSRGSHFRCGYVVGGGVEYALNDRWRLKSEYLFSSIAGFPFFDLEQTLGAVKPQSHLLRVGLNYALWSKKGVDKFLLQTSPLETPPTALKWTGLHFDVNAGLASNSLGIHYYELGEGDRTVKGFGVIGGVEGGFDYQLPNDVVLGFSADYHWGSIQAFRNRIEEENSNAWDLRVQSFGSLRGRVGYALGNLLPFVTGGFTYGTLAFRQADPSDKISQQTKTFSRQTGFTCGAGFEYFLGPHWSLKTDYQFVNLGVLSAPEVDHDWYHTNVKTSVLRTGLSYHF